MDFTFNADQEELRRTVRSFMERQSPSSYVRAMIDDERGFTDDIWLDINGSPLTSAGKTTERFRRLNYGTLEIEVKVDDPKSYTRPWTVKVTQRIAPDTELNEFICEDRDLPHLVGAKQ